MFKVTMHFRNENLNHSVAFKKQQDAELYACKHEFIGHAMANIYKGKVFIGRKNLNDSAVWYVEN